MKKRIILLGDPKHFRHLLEMGLIRLPLMPISFNDDMLLLPIEIFV